MDQETGKKTVDFPLNQSASSTTIVITGGTPDSVEITWHSSKVSPAVSTDLDESLARIAQLEKGPLLPSQNRTGCCVCWLGCLICCMHTNDDSGYRQIN